MCGFLVVGSSELELQVFNDALNQAAIVVLIINM